MIGKGREHLVKGKYTVRDLIDVEKLHDIFEKFTQVTGYTTGFVSYPDLEVLFGTGWRDVCTKYHRACPAGEALCKKSNTSLLRKLTNVGQINKEKCEHGLYDVATPIIIDGVYIAAVATGQALFEEPDLGWFRAHAEEMGFGDVEDYISCVKELPVSDEESFNKATEFLAATAAMVCEDGLVRLEQKENTLMLNNEIKAREKAERALRNYQDHLEALVAERTRELRDAQEKLVRSERLAVIGELAGSIAHELRTPLGAIKNAGYYIDRVLGAGADKKIAKHLNILEEEITNANRIITDVLTFGRMKEPQLKKANINTVINNSLGKYGRPENVKLKVFFEDDLPELQIDEFQISQTLLNVMLNAIHSMPSGGTLTISSSMEGENVLIEIKDTGIGIAKENLGKVFDPLFSTKVTGTGLGLSTCQIFLGMHGGKIDIESEEGKGTKVAIRLPVGKEEKNV